MINEKKMKDSFGVNMYYNLAGYVSSNVPSSDTFLAVLVHPKCKIVSKDAPAMSFSFPVDNPFS